MVTIPNRLGMHARPAAMISKIAQQAEKSVWISLGEAMAEASSVIDMLSIGCKQGSQVQVSVETENDIKLLELIIDLIQSGFGEEP